MVGRIQFPLCYCAEGGFHIFLGAGLLSSLTSIPWQQSVAISHAVLHQAIMLAICLLVHAKVVHFVTLWGIWWVCLMSLCIKNEGDM